MKIKFIQSPMIVKYANSIGDVIEVNEATAIEFIELGIAEKVMETAVEETATEQATREPQGIEVAAKKSKKK